MVGIIDKTVHPYTVFSSNRVSTKNYVGMNLVYYPYQCTFLILPSLLSYNYNQ